jgi:hypothetical protein
MLPPSCFHAAATQQSCCHCGRCVATAATMLPRFCHHLSATTTLLPPPRCWVCRRVATKLPLPPLLPLPPCHHHCHPHCQAHAATTKLLPLLLSTLQDRFDNKEEFCKMTDVDFFQLTQLFQPGVKFLHGEMVPIFDALVYLSLNHIHL